MSRPGGMRVFVAAVTLVVAAVVVAAVFVLGSPAEQRMIRLDQQRVTDLIGLRNAIKRDVQRNTALPKDLAAVSSAPPMRVRRIDPETGAPYEYEIVGERSYRLCAVFARPSESDRTAMPYINEAGWDHEAGRQCFDLTEPSPK